MNLINSNCRSNVVSLENIWQINIYFDYQTYTTSGSSNQNRISTPESSAYNENRILRDIFI